jgi:hypothetical protein
VRQVDDRIHPLAEAVLAAAGLLRRFHRKTPENVVSDIGFQFFPILRFPRKCFELNAFQRPRIYAQQCTILELIFAAY